MMAILKLLLLTVMVGISMTTAAADKVDFVAGEPDVVVLKEPLEGESVAEINPTPKMTGRANDHEPVDVIVEESIEDDGPVGEVQPPIAKDPDSGIVHRQNSQSGDEPPTTTSITKSPGNITKKSTATKETTRLLERDPHKNVGSPDENAETGLWITIALLAVIIAILFVIWLILQKIKKRKVENPTVVAAVPATEPVVVVDGAAVPIPVSEKSDSPPSTA